MAAAFLSQEPREQGCVCTQVCVHRCACRAALMRFEPRAGGAPALLPRNSTEVVVPHAPSGASAIVAKWDFPRDLFMPHYCLSVPLGKAGAPKGHAEEMLVQRVWGCSPLLKTHLGMASSEPGSHRFIGKECREHSSNAPSASGQQG